MTVKFSYAAQGSNGYCEGRQFSNVKSVSIDSHEVQLTLANGCCCCVAEVRTRNGYVLYEIHQEGVAAMFRAAKATHTELYVCMTIDA